MEGNYNKFWGKNNKEEKKKDIAAKIAAECNKVSKCNRTAKSVLSKIQYIKKPGKGPMTGLRRQGRGF